MISSTFTLLQFLLLQVQRQNTVYRGTFDACFKILRTEGFGALYKGFLINTMQVGSGISYILTYEKVKDLLFEYRVVKDGSVRSLIGGAVGSLVGQTIITPFDVVSQHMMVVSGTKSDRKTNRFSYFSNPLYINRKDVEKFGLAYAIVRELHRNDGVKGFYRGYFASLACYVPSSALWWFFYEKYSGMLAHGYLFTVSTLSSFLLAGIIHRRVPGDTWHLLIRSCAAILSGATTAILTNPLDVIRANMQVQRMSSYSSTVRKLWSEENFCILYKGLSARVTQNCLSSALISIGYETLKRLSIRDEYKNQVKW